jgi:hypothetical protein
MWVELKSNLFSEEANPEGLVLLLNLLIYKRQHEVFVELTEVRETLVYQSLLSSQKKILEELYTRLINDSAKINKVVSIVEEQDVFNVDEAILYFKQPVLIVLENIFYDAFFLDAIFKNYKKKSKKIKRHFEHRWLKYENAGGAGNIIHLINSYLKSFNSLPKSNKEEYIRIIVIRDSDKKHSDDTYKNDDVEKLVKTLNTSAIPYHILEKREMENYLPDEVLKNIGTDYIDSYLKLSGVQKDYFDFEKGFEDKGYQDSKITAKTNGLYNDVAEKEWKVLRLGMNDSKTILPRLFEKPEVTREALEKRVEHQNQSKELEEIINKINKLL